MEDLQINWKKNLFFVWISQFLAMAGFGCCMPFIPLLLKDNLGVADENLRGLYVSIYQFAGMTSLCLATAGWGILADKFGRKLMLLRASYCAGLFYPLLAFAPNFPVLVAIRFIVSFFAGTVNPAQTLLIVSTPENKQGFVLGTLSTAIWSGDVVGFLVGGVIAEFYGYTAAFLTCGVLYLIGAVLVHIFVEEHFVRPAKGQGRKKKEKFNWKKLATPAVIGIFLLFLLLGIARRIETPFIAMMVETVNGADKAAFFTGIVSATAALGGVISGVLIGWLCDKYSVYKLIIPVVIVGVVTLIFQAFSPNIWSLIISRFLVFLAAGGVPPILQIMLSRTTDPALRGSYFGFTASISQFGGLVCAALGGVVAYFMNIRGIFFAAAIFFALMIPVLVPTIRFCRKEEVQFHTDKEAPDAN